MDFWGILEQIAELWVGLAPQIESMAGLIKVFETVLLIFTMLGLFWIGRRIRNNAASFKKDIERTTDHLESRLNDVSHKVDDRLKEGIDNFDQSIVQLLEGISVVTTRMNMLRADVAEIERQQDRTFVSVDQIPVNQSSVSEGLAYWEQVRDAWSEVRAGLQDVVIAIPNKQRRARFEAIDRRDYSVAIDRMRKGNLINSDAQAHALKVMNIFHAAKNRKVNTTEEQARQAAEAAEQFLLATSNERASIFADDQVTLSRRLREASGSNMPG